MKIAIIGGGISGLSLAYYLEQKNIDYILFEKEQRLGGNACTLHTRHNGQEKYVDMGVNDFNPNTYTLLGDLLAQTGAETGQVNVNTTFFSAEGFLFKESDLTGSALNGELQRFRYEAMEAIHDERFRLYSVKDYFEEKGYSEDFRKQYLYPRIQGLFFYPPDGLDQLPVYFVMNFYALQGGFQYQSAPKSKRANFKGGAGAWIEKLSSRIPSGKICRGSIPAIRRMEGGFLVKITEMEVRVDKVVFACHADDLCKRYGHLLSPAQLNTLSRVKYAGMVSVAHCDSDYLPVSENQVSAYNCTVKDPAETDHTYTITYNCNEHQNLSGGGACPGDLFFVSVNPTREIAQQYILKDENGAPLVKGFRRNICDFELLQAQDDLREQQGINGLYFTGGYTNGIGLHENCLKQSAEISEMLAKGEGSGNTTSWHYQMETVQDLMQEH